MNVINREYVVGFCFDTTMEHVLLINKKRPDWQAGKLNGIGGKIEEHEIAPGAMRREFGEETGLYIPDWEYKGVLIKELADQSVPNGYNADVSTPVVETWSVHVFLAKSNLIHSSLNRVYGEDEEVPVLITIRDLHKRVNILPTVSWFIPMIMHEHVKNFKVYYNESHP